jgi:protein nanos 1
LWSFNNQFWNTKTENFVTSANGHAKRGSTSSAVNIENANGGEAEYCDLVQSIAIDTNHYNSSEVEQIRSEFENNGRDSGFHFEDADTTESFNPSTFSPPKVKLDDASKYMNGLKGFQREDLMTPNKPVVSKKKFKPHKKSLSDFCVFCKNNGAPESVYKTHTVKDAKGRALCPKLRIYKCPICGVDGDDAHTKKYCPMKPIVTEADTAKTY